MAEIEGAHSAGLSDILTQRQIYVEQAKASLHDQYSIITLAVVMALLQALARNRVTNFQDADRVTLSRIVNEVLVAFDAASATYKGNVISWLQRYTREEHLFFAVAVRAAIVTPGEGMTPADLNLEWGPIAAGILGATGLSLEQTLSKLIADQRINIRQAIQRAHALNLRTDSLLAAMEGTPSRLRKDGILTKMSNFAATTVDTLVQFGMSMARNQSMQKFLNYIVGYTWVSVLDARTSDICRSLSGQRFAFGQGPMPPMHLRCRSHVEPVFSLETVFREGFGAAFRAGETYYEWLKRQPETIQDDVLGRTKGSLFRKGGLTAAQFAVTVVDRKFQPLTLEELRKKFPNLFRNARV